MKHIAEKLQNGERVVFRPRGNSMRGRVENGQEVEVVPNPSNVAVNDVVLCKVKGRYFLHLVKAMRKQGEKNLYLIGNNVGGTNGWIGRDSIYGKLVE